MTLQVSSIAPRLDTKPWGGRRLERLGIDLGSTERVGEALVTAGDVIVTGGTFAGQPLDMIVRAAYDEQIGTVAREAVSGHAIFPFLAKLIDATGNLSIQVHPDDAGAQVHGKLGKTEAWHVLAADSGSVLYLGIQPGVTLDEFREAAGRLDGSTAALMRAVPAQVGTTVLIPAGTIHALGAGVVVYEVQQPSDITYRLDDWGRLNDDGQPRELHLNPGIDVARPDLVPEIISPVRLRAAIGERHLLAACQYFALERVALPVGGSAPLGLPGSPVVVTVVTGAGTIGGESIGPGSSAVVWPSVHHVALRATEPLAALVAYVPDLEPDVVHRALASGASAATIAALGGPTRDVAQALAVASSRPAEGAETADLELR